MNWPFWIALVTMFIGTTGTLLPLIPGTPLIFVAAAGYGYFEHFQKVTPVILSILFGLMVITYAVDYFAGMIGAKKYGASKYGTWGTFIGGILGVVFLNIPGLIIGPFVGAVAGEMINGTEYKEAFKVGFGSMLGMAGGALLKFLFSIIMIIIFITAVY